MSDARVGPAQAELAGLLGDFLRPDGAERLDHLEGEELLLTIDLRAPEGRALREVRFVADGVWQVHTAQPFDALRCARALREALDGIPSH